MRDDKQETHLDLFWLALTQDKHPSLVSTLLSIKPVHSLSIHLGTEPLSPTLTGRQRPNGDVFTICTFHCTRAHYLFIPVKDDLVTAP